MGAALMMTACNVKAVPDDGDFDGFAWDHAWSGAQDTVAFGEADSGEAGGGGEADAGSGLSCWGEDLGTAEGDLAGSGNQADGDNVYDCLGGTGREVVFRRVVRTPDTYTISTHGSPSDTVLELREGCEGASLGCNDDSRMGLSSELRVPLDSGVEITIIADSFSAYREDLVVLNID